MEKLLIPELGHLVQQAQVDGESASLVDVADVRTSQLPNLHLADS